MYEYSVIPAPRRPKKFKGVKGAHAQFAQVVAELINKQAQDGWEYLRSETLPVDEKPGLLKSRVETYHSVMIFRRLSEAEMPAVEEEIYAPADAEVLPVELDEDIPAQEPEVEEHTIDHGPAEPRLTRD